MPTFTTDNATLHYQDSGSGPPLVLIHGATSASNQMEPAVAALARHHRVVAPDLRGMGRSSRVDDHMPAGAWVTDLIALLAHLDIERVHLAGLSLGARIAARFAFDHPDRALSLTIDATILWNEHQGSAALNQMFGDLDDSHPLAGMWAAAHGADWRDVVIQFVRTRGREDIQTFYDLREMVASSRVPTLIVRNDSLSDVVHPLEHSLEWHRLRPDSWLWIVPGVTDPIMSRCADDLSDLHQRFLAAHEVA